LILHTTVGIGYDVPWETVEELLIDAAGRVEGLRDEPPPFILEQSLDNYSVTYELNVYCTEPGRIPYLYADLHRSILTVFRERGVEIMTPTYVSLPDDDVQKAEEIAKP
jgi:small-conductance mechanosensitive channel